MGQRIGWIQSTLLLDTSSQLPFVLQTCHQNLILPYKLQSCVNLLLILSLVGHHQLVVVSAELRQVQKWVLSKASTGASGARLLALRGRGAEALVEYWSAWLVDVVAPKDGRFPVPPRGSLGSHSVLDLDFSMAVGFPWLLPGWATTNPMIDLWSGSRSWKKYRSDSSRPPWSRGGAVMAMKCHPHIWSSNIATWLEKRSHKKWWIRRNALPEGNPAHALRSPRLNVLAPECVFVDPEWKTHPVGGQCDWC